MKGPEVSISTLAVLSALTSAASVGMCVIFFPIWARAVRTGRLLAKWGIVYDRRTTPIKFWLGVSAMFAIIILLSFCASILLFETVFKLFSVRGSI